MFSRQISTLLPSRTEAGSENVREELHNRANKMVDQDSTPRKTQLNALFPGQSIRILSHRNHRWFPGRVLEADTSNPRSYKVLSNNRVLRRNRSQLREAIPTTPRIEREQTNISPYVSPAIRYDRSLIKPTVLFQEVETPQAKSNFRSDISESEGRTNSATKQVRFSPTTEVYTPGKPGLEMTTEKVKQNSENFAIQNNNSQNLTVNKNKPTKQTKIKDQEPEKAITTRAGRIVKKNSKYM